MRPERPRRLDLRGWRTAASLASVGLTLALSIGIGVAIGVAMDRWLHTRFLVIVFTLLGVVAGFQQLIKAVIQANRDQERAESEDRE